MLRTRDFTMATVSYFALAVLMALALCRVNWTTYRELANHGVAVIGRIVEPTCAQHQTFKFEFQVNRQVIHGVSGAGYGNPECHSLTAGDPVTITYLRRNPAINTAGSAAARLRNETVSIALGAFSMPALLVGIVLYRYRRQRRAG